MHYCLGLLQSQLPDGQADVAVGVEEPSIPTEHPTKPCTGVLARLKLPLMPVFGHTSDDRHSLLRSQRNEPAAGTRRGSRGTVTETETGGGERRVGPLGPPAFVLVDGSSGGI